MKTKLTLLLIALVAGTSAMFAQATEECVTTMSIFSEQAKIKNYDGAYESFMKLRKDCPKTSFALYQYGERILKHKIANASGAEKKAFLDDLKKMYEEKKSNFPNKTKVGDDLADVGLEMYDNKIGTVNEQYAQFEKAWDTDAATFTNAKGLYIYFTLAVAMHENGNLELQEVFDLYDKLQDKVTEDQNQAAEKLNKILEKEENGETLTSQEKKTKNASEKNLEAYSKIVAGINQKLGVLADCDRLVPFYQKDFEEKKGDVAWVKSAAGRLVAKECTDSDVFVQLVEQLNTLEPSPETSFYLGRLAERNGENAKAVEYYEEAIERQTDPVKKAKALARLGSNYQDKGQFSKARSYYLQAVELQPSMGRLYLQIANMYAKSANNCGSDVFEKRAVYWKAAEMASRAGQLDPSISSQANSSASSYRGLAPDRTMIFNSNKQGQKITFNCWIGGSVTVPNL